MSRITDLKRKKLWFEQETGQVYTRFWNTSTTQKNSLKQLQGEKNKWKIKIKNNRIYNTYQGPLSQE